MTDYVYEFLLLLLLLSPVLLLLFPPTRNVVRAITPKSPAYTEERLQLNELPPHAFAYLEGCYLELYKKHEQHISSESPHMALPMMGSLEANPPCSCGCCADSLRENRKSLLLTRSRCFSLLELDRRQMLCDMLCAGLIDQTTYDMYLNSTFFRPPLYRFCSRGQSSHHEKESEGWPREGGGHFVAITHDGRMASCDARHGL